MASERDRLAFRAWREEEEARERAEQAERERPIREATEELNKLHRKVFAKVRERLLNMEDVDEDGRCYCWVDPSVDGMRMDWSLAMSQNADEYKAFIRAESAWYFHCDANMRTLLGYLERNHCQIFTQEMLKRAALRLDEYHLLEERPPEPPKPVPVEVNLTIDRSMETPAPVTYTGYDQQTGLEREFTAREVDRMSADEFRRIFRVYRSDLVLPNAGPGPMGFRG
jgi:hypothetical protein